MSQIESIKEIKEIEEIEGVEADRVLASIVKIDNLLPIEGADKIEIAEVKGWKCVVQKNDFNIGDLAVYYCEDSMPNLEDPNFEFLKIKGIKRIKIMKIRGIYSQGLLGPIEWMKGKVPNILELKEGDDVTQLLQVRKYVQPEEIEQYNGSNNGSNNGPNKTKNLSEFTNHFPSCVPKTDEERLQNNLDFLRDILNREIIITRKEDGCSCTFVFNKGNFNVCGRNYVWLKGHQNALNYFKIEELYNVKNKMESYGKNIAIQGELIGPKINGNKMGLKTLDFEVFNIFDIDSRKYLNYDDVTHICNLFQLKQVPLLFRGLSNDLELNIDDSQKITIGELANNMDENIKKILAGLLEMTNNLNYDQTNGKTTPAEGIVIKTNDDISRVSFKVISQVFTLKHNK